jgi:hypothetical protein
MPAYNLWAGTVSTSSVGNVDIRIIRNVDEGGAASYILEYKVATDLLTIQRWFVLLTVNVHSIIGAPQPDGTAIYQLFTEACRHLGDASKRKHALLAQVTSTTITQALLDLIVAEVAAGEVT